MNKIKKTFSALIIVAVVFALSACGTNQPSQGSEVNGSPDDGLFTRPETPSQPEPSAPQGPEPAPEVIPSDEPADKYMESNGIIRLDNGHLSYLLDYEEDITPSANQLKEFYEKQKGQGKYFLFVLTPFQVYKYEDIIPDGYTDLANHNADKLITALNENGTPYLDLREAMENEGIDHNDAFWKTDHHWKPETGFWAYTKIIETLEAQGAFDTIDSKYTNLDEFNVTIYENWYLGSNGKQTGAEYAGVDDFALITPKFETKGMSVEIPSMGLRKKGDFEEVALDMEKVRLDYENVNMHAVYGNDDSDFASYRNSSAPVDLKVMSVGDSFGNIPSAFLTLVFGAVDEFDMRYYALNFEEYYFSYDPDIVIITANTYGVTGENVDYNFFSE